jgi:hypothetical protein
MNYKEKYLKYKQKYITLKNSNLFTNRNNNIISKPITLLEKIDNNQILNNFSVSDIPCIDNEKCNKTGIFKKMGSHNINHILEPCEGWNCI